MQPGAHPVWSVSTAETLKIKAFQRKIFIVHRAESVYCAFA